jgi:hypothetical protein
MRSSSGSTPSWWARSRRTEALPGALACVLALALAPACSDDAGEAGDAGPGWDVLAGDGGGGGDLAPDGAGGGPACTASASLLGKVSASRMLKDLNYLVGLGERRTHASQQKAAAYLRAELAKLSGIKVREHSYTWLGQTYVNLEVTIAGSQATDEYLMTGAHYDSSSNHPTQAPGADDNASGTAAVLEATRALAGCKPRRNIRLLFFSNEEKGAVGSQFYVKSIKATLPKDKLLGFINVDMVGYGPDTEDLDLATRPAYKALADEVGAAVQQWTTLKVKQVVSDHCG